ncbi:MAG: BamA/TamA family outer membrane protein [bacterium]|nr:BamA/TamA family outer membrane protein [bacterium]
MKQKSNYILVKMLVAACVMLLTACSTTKHVPEGKYLLDDVKINITDKDKDTPLKSAEMMNYLRQIPNHKVLGGLRLQLAFYNLSGKDSTNWFNKWVRRVGSAPVIYDPSLTEASVKQLSTALANKGYMNSTVTVDTLGNLDKKRMKVTYNVTFGQPHYVSSISYNIPNDTLRELILADSAQFLVKQNSVFDRNLLDEERQGISERLRSKGYFAFNKEYITFTADTAAGEKNVNLTMNLMRPYLSESMPYYTSHRPFYVRNVTFVTSYNPATMHNSTDFDEKDLVWHNDYRIFYGDDRYLRASVLEESCFISPGKQYNSKDVDRTYEAFGRLGIVKFVNIELVPVGEIDGKIWLDAYVLLSRTKPQTASVSLEGTNSEGDFGFGVGLGYQHRNVFKGSEILNAKFKASYESLSGDLSGFINDNYSEYQAELGIRYPKFKAPFLKRSFKQKILAQTEFALNFNYQERPEYTRVIAGAGWRYLWSERTNKTRHTFNLMDLNYVNLPKSKSSFIENISNPLLRYSYEDHLIMRMGYSYYHSNKKEANMMRKLYQPDVYTIRVATETAGNLLYGISNLIGQDKEDGTYKVVGINYSQYFKVDADYSFTHSFNPKSSLAFHVGVGAAMPYGNSKVLPFEKRFYAGGANSVRGWGVRTLGPGSYFATNSVNSFIYQCGDIRLDLNLEYRAKLFWVLELGAFIDAGNIWTIREYEDQPGGVFKFNKFYEQIALSYGLGIRMDFTYFLLRLDVGMKAHNPASGQERWPLLHPDWGRDSAFHFSVGYPF